LAVINELPKSWDVLVVGRKYTFEGQDTLSFEFQTAQKMGIPFRALTTGRLQRKFTAHTFASLLKVPIGVMGAIGVIREYKPDVVLSFGGYVSVPVVVAASMMRVPIIIHEQVLGAGLANKFAARFADKVCISWKESERYFPKEKIVLTGNPVKKFSISNVKFQMSNENLPVLYITGGSGGAHAINVLMEGCLDKLLEHFIVIHQTGDAKEFGDFERLEKIRENFSEKIKHRYVVRKFVEPSEVFGIMHHADLVISRSGVNTVTELLYVGKPCILIPLPYGQRNEQLENALFVQRTGLGVVAEQNSLTSEKLYQLILSMMEKIDEYKKHSAGAKKLVNPRAAEKIIEVVSSIYEQKTVKTA